MTRFLGCACLAVSQSLLVLSVLFSADNATAQQLRVACVGEATTHSAHREYDPEYPELMGRFMDDDFVVAPSPENPMSGGMLYGEGSRYHVGNFGIPKGSAMDHPPTDQAESTLRSPQLALAEEFAPHLVVLGPYGPHEPYTDVDIARFRADFRRLVERIQAFSSSPAVLISLPLPRDAVDNNDIRRRIYVDTAAVADELELPTIDLWSEFLGRADEFEDQNHLNLAGRERMARVVSEAVDAWGRDGPTSPDAGAGGSAGGSEHGSAGVPAADASGGRGGGAGRGSGGWIASGGSIGEVEPPSAAGGSRPSDTSRAGEAAGVPASGGAGPATAGGSGAAASPALGDTPSMPASGSTGSADPASLTEPATGALPTAAAPDSAVSGAVRSPRDGVDRRRGSCAVELADPVQTWSPGSYLAALGFLFLVGRRRRAARPRAGCSCHSG